MNYDSNNGGYNNGGWRDSMLRKNLNDESTGTIWNAIQSADFKNNITPVLKTTNNNANDDKGNSYNTSYNTSNASSTTADKLYILSPSEMGMPLIKNYKNISGYYVNQSDANVHYYDSDSYKNTIKSKDSDYETQWYGFYSYLYDGNAYQWWMLPAGSRKMSNDNQAYHNTDSYSYGALFTSSNPSTNNSCFPVITDSYAYWLRSSFYYGFARYMPDYDYRYGHLGCGYLTDDTAYNSDGVVVSFSF